MEGKCCLGPTRKSCDVKVSLEKVNIHFRSTLEQSGFPAFVYLCQYMIEGAAKPTSLPANPISMFVGYHLGWDK